MIFIFTFQNVELKTIPIKSEWFIWMLRDTDERSKNPRVIKNRYWLKIIELWNRNNPKFGFELKSAKIRFRKMAQNFISTQKFWVQIAKNGTWILGLQEVLELNFQVAEKVNDLI